MALQFNMNKYRYESNPLSVREEMMRVLDRRLRELEFEAEEIGQMLKMLDRLDI